MIVWVLENGEWIEASYDVKVHYLCPECTEGEGEDTYHRFEN